MRFIIPFIAALLIFSYMIQYANAQSYGLTIDPDVLPTPSDTAIAEFCAGVTDLTITEAKIIDPLGTEYNTAVNLGVVSAGDCVTWDIPTDFGIASLTPIGSWSMVVDTTEGNPVIEDFIVTFFVLPESVIGAIAMIGASIAILGVYMLRKRSI